MPALNQLIFGASLIATAAAQALTPPGLPQGWSPFYSKGQGPPWDGAIDGWVQTFVTDILGECNDDIWRYIVSDPFQFNHPAYPMAGGNVANITFSVDANVELADLYTIFHWALWDPKKGAPGADAPGGTEYVPWFRYKLYDLYLRSGPEQVEKSGTFTWGPQVSLSIDILPEAGGGPATPPRTHAPAVPKKRIYTTQSCFPFQKHGTNVGGSGLPVTQRAIFANGDVKVADYDPAKDAPDG